MRGLLVGIALLASCSDDPAIECAPGTHADGEMCVDDTTCMANSCNGHGTCSTDGTAVACACDAEYTGPNCGACAGGFQDHGDTGICAPACAMQCGRFGQCDDSTGAIVCTCNGGTTGATCDACDATTATILDDTFGGTGAHTLDVTPNVTIVAMLPSAATGELRFNMITGMPTEGSQKFTLAFSRCPADLTYADSQRVGGMTPCMLQTTSATGGSIHWTQTPPQTGTECLLPPGDGPWYANLKVEYSLLIETCDDAGPCKMSWQWN
ncbi:MAG: hypothetical protein AB7T06_26940 [Kofleriaceae bacterium]